MENAPHKLTTQLHNSTGVLAWKECHFTQALRKFGHFDKLSDRIYLTPAYY
jgi:hypothetical protein